MREYRLPSCARIEWEGTAILGSGSHEYGPHRETCTTAIRLRLVVCIREIENSSDQLIISVELRSSSDLLEVQITVYGHHYHG